MVNFNLQLSKQIPTELEKTKLGEAVTYKPQMFPWSHHTVSILGPKPKENYFFVAQKMLRLSGLVLK